MNSVGTKYDAFLLISFGGPEGMHDVMPFLENVLHGKKVSQERIDTVFRQYELFNGKSPLNEQNRQLLKAVERKFKENGWKLPIYWGNRNWHPLLSDTVKQMAADGIKNAIAFVTSAYSSYSGCRQYLENIEQARSCLNTQALQIDKIKPFYNHPQFIEANVSYLIDALNTLPEKRRSEAAIIFTAHSIPLSMAQCCFYTQQLIETMNLVMNKLNDQGEAINNTYSLVYQSRSGYAQQAWLEPDINEHVRILTEKGVQDVVVAPIGFVCDHMEIIYDLDTQVRELCEKLTISYTRAKTVSSHPAFISMIGDLLYKANERLDITNRELCRPGCCLS